MAKKLFDNKPGEAISPLIDVVMNAFGAMFIILMIYMAVASVSKQRPIKFIEQFEVPPAVQGQSYLFTLPVVNGMGQRHFRLISGELQSWNLRFDTNTGTIFGTPRVLGAQSSYPVHKDLVFEVADEGNSRDRHTNSLVVHEGAVPFSGGSNVKLAYRSSILPAGRVGEPYEFVIGSTGAVGTVESRLVSGSLTNGLSLNPTAVEVFGQPTTASTQRFTLQVEHQAGMFVHRGTTNRWSASQDRREFQVEILPPLQHSLKLPIGQVGDSFMASLVTGQRLAGESIEMEIPVPGLAADIRTGAISGVPTAPGVFRVSYQIRNANRNLGSGAEDLIVLPARPTQAVGGISIHGWVGVEMNASLPYQGMKEPVLITNTSPLPAGLRITANHLLGVPQSSGSFGLQVTAKDSLGTSANGNLEIRVHPLPETIAATNEIEAPLVVGRPVLWLPPFNGGAGRLTWSFEGSLPPGLTAAGGLLTGSIKSRGTWPLKIIVADSVGGKSVVQQVSFRGVLPEESAIRISTIAIPPVFMGVPFDFVFAAEGGVGLPRFSFAGDLPVGLRFTTNGISGTAQTVGDWRVTSTVVDEVGQRDGPRQLLLSVRYGDQSQPLLLTTNIPPAVVGIAYDFAFSIGGGVGVPVFSLSGELPRGLKFTSTGISGVAQEIRDSSVEVSATDQAGRKTPPRRFAFRSLPNEVTKPEVITSMLQPAVRGQQYLHEFAGEGGIGRYRWSVAGDLPQGLKVGAHGIEGTVSREARLGNWNLRLSVRDEAGNLSPEKALQLIVIDPK